MGMRVFDFGISEKRFRTQRVYRLCGTVADLKTTFMLSYRNN